MLYGHHKGKKKSWCTSTILFFPLHFPFPRLLKQSTFSNNGPYLTKYSSDLPKLSPMPSPCWCRHVDMFIRSVELSNVPRIHCLRVRSRNVMHLAVTGSDKHNHDFTIWGPAQSINSCSMNWPGCSLPLLFSFDIRSPFNNLLNIASFRPIGGSLARLPLHTIIHTLYIYTRLNSCYFYRASGTILFP